ncbi:hypothetical protein EYF80_036544 [Liparis tanakae]|uniref:Uncharacterized protein n=1 Tax=Liparis tanakae TaxID=230148 RepID=A0A4Z2GK77_9TELE|nr:hypothetical protein EYF80_036544 [Liparis tanakae]
MFFVPKMSDEAFTILSSYRRHSSCTQRAVMDDPSTAQSFPNLHPHSPEPGYPSSQPAPDPQEQYGNRGEESANSFPPSSTTPAGDRSFPNTRGSGLDEDADLGGHLSDTWYGGSTKEDVWDDVEDCESAADGSYRRGDCYSHANDVFYPVNCGSEERARRKLREDYSNYAHAGCEGGAVYNREADVSHFITQAASYSRPAAGSFSENGGDYSRASDHYVGREEDYGSSCGSGEDQLQPAEVEGPWLRASPSSSYTQKLDSFSEAFPSQRKRRFPMVPGGNASGQIRDSCAFDSDSYLPPSSSSSSPPTHPSLLSFPSPPSSCHITSSVLSPPPTPLPPLNSPPEVDSPVACGVTGHSTSQGGESLGALQFFASHLQSLPSVHPPGMLWRFPPLTHRFQQSSGDPGVMEGDLRPSHGGGYGNITGEEAS